MPAIICGSPTQDGSPCIIPVGTEGAKCLWHDPDKKREAQAARKRGAAKSNGKRAKVRTVKPEETPGPPPESLEDAIRWASWAVAAVATGQIDARTGHEVGFLLRAFLDGRKRADDVDRRVRELSAKLAKLEGSAS